MNAKTSLLHQLNPLAKADSQRAVLDNVGQMGFLEKLTRSGAGRLTANRVEILQVNLGKLCNMTCVHCHVDAGPDRREVMTSEIADACLDVLERHPQIKTLDLTGGAPEMNANFRRMVTSARQMGRHVIDRCNLTILLARGFDDLPEFLARNRVEVVASLPCYRESNTDAQRGEGAYSKSIEAIRRLNGLGYGAAESGLVLTLVYNPVGACLPPGQAALESDYRRELNDRFGIRFNRLFTITNLPVSRYLEYLVRTRQLESYMETLVSAFNPAALDGLMCRNTISVGWDGKLFDCDFNQMLETGVVDAACGTIGDFDIARLDNRPIVTGQHCFGCTAGAGSGCQGAIDHG